MQDSSNNNTDPSKAFYQGVLAGLMWDEDMVDELEEIILQRRTEDGREMNQ